MLDLRRAARSHRLLATVLLVAVVAVVLQGASVPHTHAGIGAGLYNQDHDRSLLATLHATATLAAAQPAIVRLAVVTAVAPVATSPIDSAALPSAASRAPPLA
jgi:hypothetical protein